MVIVSWWDGNSDDCLSCSVGSRTLVDVGSFFPGVPEIIAVTSGTGVEFVSVSSFLERNGNDGHVCGWHGTVPSDIDPIGTAKLGGALLSVLDALLVVFGNSQWAVVGHRQTENGIGEDVVVPCSILCHGCVLDPSLWRTSAFPLNVRDRSPLYNHVLLLSKFHDPDRDHLNIFRVLIILTDSEVWILDLCLEPSVCHWSSRCWSLVSSIHWPQITSISTLSSYESLVSTSASSSPAIATLKDNGNLQTYSLLRKSHFSTMIGCDEGPWMATFNDACAVIPCPNSWDVGQAVCVVTMQSLVIVSPLCGVHRLLKFPPAWTSYSIRPGPGCFCKPARHGDTFVCFADASCETGPSKACVIGRVPFPEGDETLGQFITISDWSGCRGASQLHCVGQSGSEEIFAACGCNCVQVFALNVHERKGRRLYHPLLPNARPLIDCAVVERENPLAVSVERNVLSMSGFALRCSGLRKISEGAYGRSVVDVFSSGDGGVVCALTENTSWGVNCPLLHENERTLWCGVLSGHFYQVSERTIFRDGKKFKESEELLTHACGSGQLLVWACRSSLGVLDCESDRVTVKKMDGQVSAVAIDGTAVLCTAWFSQEVSAFLLPSLTLRSFHSLVSEVVVRSLVVADSLVCARADGVIEVYLMDDQALSLVFSMSCGLTGCRLSAVVARDGLRAIVSVCGDAVWRLCLTVNGWRCFRVVPEVGGRVHWWNARVKWMIQDGDSEEVFWGAEDDSIWKGSVERDPQWLNDDLPVESPHGCAVLRELPSLIVVLTKKGLLVLDEGVVVSSQTFRRHAVGSATSLVVGSDDGDFRTFFGFHDTASRPSGYLFAGRIRGPPWELCDDTVHALEGSCYALAFSPSLHRVACAVNSEVILIDSDQVTSGLVVTARVALGVSRPISCLHWNGEKLWMGDMLGSIACFAQGKSKVFSLSTQCGSVKSFACTNTDSESESVVVGGLLGLTRLTGCGGDRLVKHVYTSGPVMAIILNWVVPTTNKRVIGAVLDSCWPEYE